MRERLATATAIARQAGRLLLEVAEAGFTVGHKAPSDLVTEADLRSEELIIRELARHFPQDSCIAEESSPEAAAAGGTWIVDPLDGTTNFAHGFPQYAVSIAYEDDGVVQLGVVYDPNRDEMFNAVLGGGATLNGLPLRVSGVTSLADALLGTGLPYWTKEQPSEVLSLFGLFAMNSQAIRRPGAASLDLAYVACGRCDGFWEIGLKLWDTAAGALLVTEAGGVVSGLPDGPFEIRVPRIMASNGLIADEMKAVVAALADA